MMGVVSSRCHALEYQGRGRSRGAVFGSDGKVAGSLDTIDNLVDVASDRTLVPSCSGSCMPLPQVMTCAIRRTKWKASPPSGPPLQSCLHPVFPHRFSKRHQDWVHHGRLRTEGRHCRAHDTADTMHGCEAWPQAGNWSVPARPCFRAPSANCGSINGLVTLRVPACHRTWACRCLLPLRLDCQHSIYIQCQDMEDSDGHSSCGNQGVP